MSVHCQKAGPDEREYRDDSPKQCDEIVQHVPRDLVAKDQDDCREAIRVSTGAGGTVEAVPSREMCTPIRREPKAELRSPIWMRTACAVQVFIGYEGKAPFASHCGTSIGSASARFHQRGRPWCTHAGVHREPDPLQEVPCQEVDKEDKVVAPDEREPSRLPRVSL